MEGPEMKRRFDAMALMIGICAIVGMGVIITIILAGIEFLISFVR